MDDAVKDSSGEPSVATDGNVEDDSAGSGTIERAVIVKKAVKLAPRRTDVLPPAFVIIGDELPIPRAYYSLPSCFGFVDAGSKLEICVRSGPISRDTIFGPLAAPRIPSDAPEDPNQLIFSLSDEDQCNWMGLVPICKEKSQCTLEAIRWNGQVYFRPMKPLTVGRSLIVWMNSDFFLREGPCVEGKREVHLVVRLKEVNWEVPALSFPAKPFSELGNGGRVQACKEYRRKQQEKAVQRVGVVGVKVAPSLQKKRPVVEDMGAADENSDILTDSAAVPPSKRLKPSASISCITVSELPSKSAVQSISTASKEHLPPPISLSASEKPRDERSAIALLPEDSREDSSEEPVTQPENVLENPSDITSCPEKPCEEVCSTEVIIPSFTTDGGSQEELLSEPSELNDPVFDHFNVVEEFPLIEEVESGQQVVATSDTPAGQTVSLVCDAADLVSLPVISEEDIARQTRRKKKKRAQGSEKRETELERALAAGITEEEFKRQKRRLKNEQAKARHHKLREEELKEALAAGFSSVKEYRLLKIARSQGFASVKEQKEAEAKKRRLQPKKKKTKETFICDQCDHVYRSAELLELHKFVHRPEEEPPKEGSVYFCPGCKLIVPTAKELLEHVSFHRIVSLPNASNEQRKCRICGDRFETQKELYVHRREKHGLIPVYQGASHGDGSGGQYTCIWCEEKFQSRTKLRDHYCSHIKDGRLQCPKCDKSFDPVTQMGPLFGHNSFVHEDHERMRAADPGAVQRKRRTKNEGAALKCQTCGIICMSGKKLRSHLHRLHPDSEQIKSVDALVENETEAVSEGSKKFDLPVPHDSDYIFKCLWCEVILAGPREIWRHWSAHYVDGKLPCPLNCGEMWEPVKASYKPIQAHMWTCVKNVDKIGWKTCQFCNRTLMPLYHSMHKRTCGKNPDRKHCKQNRPYVYKMKRPKLTWSEYPHPCADCQMGFTLPRSLIAHVEQAHPGRPLDAYPSLIEIPTVEAEILHCPGCPRESKSRGHLAGHVKREHPEISFVEVPEGFLANGQLIRKSLRRMEYCEPCGKSYESRAHYFMHLKLMHGGKR